MTDLWNDLQAAVPAIGQGWKRERFPNRGRYDFGVSQGLEHLFAEVGRDVDLARALVNQLGLVPPGRQLVFAIKGPTVLGVLAYFLIAFGAAIPVQLYVDAPLAKLILMLLSIVAACSVLLLTLFRELRMQARFADALLINRLIKAVEAAELVEGDLKSMSKRYYLARSIRGAADQLRKNYPPPSFSMRMTSYWLREVKIEVKRCSAVINSYGLAALSGDREEIRALKEDFVRAILRVGSGNWAQIANLQPLISIKRGPITTFKFLSRAVGFLCSIIAPILAGKIIDAIIS